MTEDSCARVSSSESDPSMAKQRKRRKWDQPDESLLSSGIAIPGTFPLANMGYLPGINLPTVSLVVGASLAIPLSTSGVTPLQVVQVPLQQHAASIVQKLVQPKIQDELIAREIVINDADSAIRYKLTKRQTQEEIQRSTGAVVITRGKYHPPNVPPDGERPLYLHISAASHLETTAERIKAVDHAAVMVEEMLKQAKVINGVKVDHLLNICVFLGFEVDPPVDIVSRIRGPNDQYVNHIMNTTGATVLLRGRGSGYSENVQTEDMQQPLHLFLSSNDGKSLEHAKLLAENLLDTICAEFGASRVSSCKVYGAVPPPPQLQAGIGSPGNASKVNDIPALSSTTTAGLNSVTQIPVPQSIGFLNPGLPQTHTACYPHGLTSGTSYIGYGGLYPQATPLQQVALALRQSTSPVTSTVSPTSEITDPTREVPPVAKDKRSQKRKFQESPATNGSTNLNQELHGRRIRVNYATERPRAGGFGGGYGAGGGGFGGGYGAGGGGFGGQDGSYGRGGYQGGNYQGGGGYGSDNHYPSGGGGGYGGGDSVQGGGSYSGGSSTYSGGQAGFSSILDNETSGVVGGSQESQGGYQEGDTEAGNGDSESDENTRDEKDVPNDYANTRN